MRRLIAFVAVLFVIASCAESTDKLAKEGDGNTACQQSQDISSRTANYAFSLSIDSALSHPSEVKTLILDGREMQDSSKIVKHMYKFHNLTALYVHDFNQFNLNLLLKQLVLLDSLKELRIEACQIQSLQNVVLIKGLKKVVSKNNGIKSLDLSVLNNSDIENLTVVEDAFYLTGKIMGLNKLKSLSMYGYRGKTLNKEIFKLTQLNELLIANSNLLNISDGILGLSNLTELIIIDSPLSKNDKSLRKLRLLLSGKCTVLTERDIDHPM